MIDWSPIWLSLRLALLTTVLLFLISLPLSYWLAYSRWRAKIIVETLVTLPMVLPPTVLGFFLLEALSPAGLAFSFPGLVIASVIYSLPFMVNPLLAGFKSLPPSLKEASQTLGKSNLTTLFRILLPNLRPSLLSGLVLSFAHTIGEFGVVMMIGGNIPGRTRVASLAIFDELQDLHYHTAKMYALILFALAFCILLALYFINHRLTRNINPLWP